MQIIKFDLLEKTFGWNKYKNFLSLANYKFYSVEKFVQVEGASSTLLDSNFTFFIYTVPINILFCGLLYLIFYILHDGKFSKHLRKFYFIKSALGVALLESNLAYFIFVCLMNLNQSFSFNWGNKIEFVFTILFLLSLLLFTFCSYLLIFKYLGKQAIYFHDMTYR